jgi:hypothetical protein
MELQYSGAIQRAVLTKTPLDIAKYLCDNKYAFIQQTLETVNEHKTVQHSSTHMQC